MYDYDLNFEIKTRICGLNINKKTQRGKKAGVRSRRKWIKSVISCRKDTRSKEDRNELRARGLVEIGCKDAKYDRGTKFALFNARSVANKVDVIKHMVIDDSLDICAITEMWLRETSEYERSELKPRGYSLMCHDRKGKKEEVELHFYAETN